MSTLSFLMHLVLAQVQAAQPAPSKPAQATPAAPSADALIARVQKFYDGTQDLRAKFEQRLESTIGGAKKASGEMSLKKPGKMRWDYAKPEKKLMLADGQVLWVYEPEDQQAFRQDLKASTLPAQVSFLVGQGKLADEFMATMATGAGVTVGDGEVAVKLVPKTATTAYRYLVFVIDDKSAMVKQTHIFDQQGGVNRLFFSDVVINKGIDDGKFKFTPPAGTRILNP